MVGEWRKHEVSKLLEAGLLIIGDGYRAKIDELGGHGLPFARAGNVNGGLRFDGADCFPEGNLARVGNKLSEPGDVVFTSKGTVGRFAFVRPGTPRFVYSPQLCFWRAGSGSVIEPRFLYYWMFGREFFVQFKGVAGQTDMAEYVSLTDQRRMHITLPPLAEQRAIAHILGTLDDRIELNRRMAVTLEAIARALFQSWFVDFDPVRAKAEGRDPGLPQHVADLFPDRFVDSELGPIPEGWDVSALGSLIHVVKGRSYKSDELADSDTALVTLKSFARGGGYRPDGLKPFTGTYKPEQVVRPGELVIACTDVTQAAEVVGRPAIVQPASEHKTLVASLDTLIIRAVDARLTTGFLYLLTGTGDFAAHAYAHTTGTTVLHLSKDAVPGFQFACPPAVIVGQFTNVAGPALQLDRAGVLAAESRTLAALRDTLLPRLVSGELRVDDAEGFLERAT